MQPELASIVDQVRAAHAAGEPLEIRGGATKRFLGEAPRGRPLETRPLSGITSYQPTELVVTALCGTPLAELEAALSERGQALAFEPPRFAEGGTVGGMVASGLSGPSRAAVGSVRDHLLGASLLDGRGELLQFGGQVIKNVAGYDVSRLLAGSFGTLGLLVDVSLKVLPVAPATATLRFACGEHEALERLHRWNGLPLPLNASAWQGGTLWLRLRGAAAAVRAATHALREEGGGAVSDELAEALWRGLRDQRHDFFSGEAPLWRLSLPQTAPPVALPGEQLIEWHGGQRWWRTPAPAATVRDLAAAAGGHATLFRAADRSGGVHSPLSPPLASIHRALKQSFDPAGIFNPGRMYPDL